MYARNKAEASDDIDRAIVLTMGFEEKRKTAGKTAESSHDESDLLHAITICYSSDEQLKPFR